MNFSNSPNPPNQTYYSQQNNYNPSNSYRSYNKPNNYKQFTNKKYNNNRQFNNKQNANPPDNRYDNTQSMYAKQQTDQDDHQSFKDNPEFTKKKCNFDFLLASEVHKKEINDFNQHFQKNAQNQPRKKIKKQNKKLKHFREPGELIIFK